MASGDPVASTSGAQSKAYTSEHETLRAPLQTDSLPSKADLTSAYFFERAQQARDGGFPLNKVSKDKVLDILTSQVQRTWLNCRHTPRDYKAVRKQLTRSFGRQTERGESTKLHKIALKKKQFVSLNDVVRCDHYSLTQNFHFLA